MTVFYIILTSERERGKAKKLRSAKKGKGETKLVKTKKKLETCESECKIYKHPKNI